MVNPAHSALAIYGDLAPEKVLVDIKKKLEAWPAVKTQEKPWPDESALIRADRTVDKKNEKTSAGLFVGTNGLALDNSRRAVLDLLDAVLSGTRYPGGRLFTALRGGSEDLVYVMHAFPFYGEKAGYFGVITQTTMANLERVQSIILENLRKLCDEPVPETELESGRDMLLTAHKLDAESLGSQAQEAAVNEVLGLGYAYEDQYVKEVRAVTAKDIQALAKELFQHTLVVRTLPEGN
jgi:zinc protease